MWVLRNDPSELLRQEGSSDTGPVLWGCSDLFGGGCAAGPLPGVWESEARGVELDCEESLLHEAVWSLCRAEVSDNDGAGCGERAEVGLAYGQGTGQGVHGGTTSTVSHCRAWS